MNTLNHADRMGETTRLSVMIADEAARATIECECVSERMGLARWWNTRPPADHGVDPAIASACTSIAINARYLELRDKIVRHPTQPHLVRFVSRGALLRTDPDAAS